ncbi:hypothetical protein EV421DRAFT_1910170 [Armillaria borealis]|uniref:Uncharacterized protein n=1 Tax=Armillaria borealis TaxID=47425 RepID=A0AA39MGX8_9AGAR|nr:hypothetical protein EV421DRAFT_1910170 [Armillaria borealis]
MARPSGHRPTSQQGDVHPQGKNQVFHPQLNSIQAGSIPPRLPVQSQHKKPEKVHEGIPTPSEDEDEDDEYTRAEEFEEDDDPDADMGTPDYLGPLSHPPITTAEEEEDELFSSPVAPPQAAVTSTYERRGNEGLEASAGSQPDPTSHAGFHQGHDTTNETILSPSPIRRVHAGGLSILNSHMRRDPESPSPSPRPLLPTQFPGVPHISFHERGAYLPLKEFQQASIQGSREYGTKGLGAPPYRPPSAGLSRPSSAAAAGSSLLPQTSAEHSGYPASMYTTSPPKRQPFLASKPLGAISYPASTMEDQALHLNAQPDIAEVSFLRNATSQRPERPSSRPSMPVPNIPLQPSTALSVPSAYHQEELLMPRPSSSATETRPLFAHAEAHPRRSSATPVPVIQITVPSPMVLSASKEVSLVEAALEQPSTPSSLQVSRPSSIHSPPAVEFTLATDLPGGNDSQSTLAGSRSNSSLAWPSHLNSVLPSQLSVVDSHDFNMAHDVPADVFVAGELTPIEPRLELQSINPSEERRGRLSDETLAQIEDTSSKIWDIIRQAISLNPAITADHIINHAFPAPTGAHKMTHWNVFLAKYKADHPSEPWNKASVQQKYAEFKDSYPDNEWKVILDEYVKVMDLDAGYMTRGKRQTVFRNTFNEFSKQLDYNARRNGFEGILALVGANPTNDGPSMMAFHETELARGMICRSEVAFEEQLDCDTSSGVRSSDAVVNLHRLEPLEGQEGSPLPDDDGHPYVLQSNIATNSNNTTQKNMKEPFVPFKILEPGNPKSAQTSCSVNFCAMMTYYGISLCMKVPPNTPQGYPDYRSCPWKRIGKALHENNMILMGWLHSLPLPINDEKDQTCLSKGGSSLSDSQRVCLAKAFEDLEIKVAQGPAEPDNDEYVFVRTAIDVTTNMYHEAVYCSATDLSNSRVQRASVSKPVDAGGVHPHQMRTRQNTKNVNRDQDSGDLQRGEKRVAFTDPTTGSNDEDDVQPQPKKKQKKKKSQTNGPKRQKLQVASSDTRDITPAATTGSNIGTSQTAANINEVRHSKTGGQPPRPRPAYKQAAVFVPAAAGRSGNAVAGPSALQGTGMDVDAFKGSEYEFADLPGGGYIELSDAEDAHPFNGLGWDDQIPGAASMGYNLFGPQAQWERNT